MKTKSALGAALRRAAPVAATSKPAPAKKAPSKAPAASAKAPKAGKAVTPAIPAKTAEAAPARKAGAKPPGWKPTPRKPRGPNLSLLQDALEGKRLLARKEVAAYLGISRQQVGILVKEGKLAEYCLGNTVTRYSLEDLHALLAATKRGGVSALLGEGDE